MIRVGLDEAGDPMLTGIGKHRGRGSYVCADAECVDRAKKNKGLHRLLRRDIPPSIYSDLQIEIEDRQKVASG